MITKAERFKLNLEELFEDLTHLKEDLSDDGFEEYAGTMEEILDRFAHVLYAMTHRDLIQELVACP